MIFIWLVRKTIIVLLTCVIKMTKRIVTFTTMVKLRCLSSTLLYVLFIVCN